MSGKPKVLGAYLNGVNDSVRSQYEGQPLASMRTPRVIRASVKGNHAFEVRVNEKGEKDDSPAREDLSWLARRATAEDARNHRAEVQQISEGLRLLLAELVPAKIKDKAHVQFAW